MCAKVFGPVFSLDARGRVGKGIVFQGRPRGSVVMKRPIPPRKSLIEGSAAQQQQRTVIAGLVAQWQALSAGAKTLWDELAVQVNYLGAGYHYFLHLKGVYPIAIPYYLLQEIGDKILLEDGYNIKLE